MFKIKNQKSKILYSGFLFCILLFYSGIMVYSQDKIVAIVNNEIITQKDLNDFIIFMRVQLSKEYTGSALEDKIASLKLDLLNRLIEDRLILQEAKKNDYKIEIRPKAWLTLKPDENRVRAKINEFKKRYPSNTEFQNDLLTQGLTQADLENKIREQLLMYNIVDFKIRSKILIRPDEVTSFYEQNTKDFIAEEERELEVFLFENEDLANSFSYNLKSGQELEDLVARYPVVVNNLKVKENEDLREEVKEIVFKLGIGEISNPIKIDEKFYIFKLNNQIPSRLQTFQEVKDRIYAFLFERKMQEKLTEWVEELKKEAYIKIVQD